MKDNNQKHNARPGDKDNKPNEGKAEETTPEALEEKVAVSKKEYEALLLKAKENELLQDKVLRAHAEFENARRRLEKDKVEFMKYANEGMIMEFLPILDNLEIAEKYIKEAKDFKAVQEGVDMIQVQIQKFMKDVGVVKVKTVGEKFDPYLHEALEIDQTKDKEDGIILEELKPGYSYNDKLLRPAMVKIVKKKV